MPTEASGQETRVLFDGHVVRLELLENKWEVVRHADAVSILVLNGVGEMLLVRQTRRAIGGPTLEAPAGLIDRGETPEQAAQRELQEEAGLSGEMRLLSRFYCSPGFCDEQVYLFQATNLEESRLPMDEDEDIEVLWMPPQQVLDGLREGHFQGSSTTITAALFAVQLLS